MNNEKKTSDVGESTIRGAKEALAFVNGCDTGYVINDCKDQITLSRKILERRIDDMMIKLEDSYMNIISSYSGKDQRIARTSIIDQLEDQLRILKSPD